MVMLTWGWGVYFRRCAMRAVDGEFGHEKKWLQHASMALGHGLCTWWSREAHAAATR